MLLAALMIFCAGVVGVSVGVLALSFFRLLRSAEELARQIRGFDQQVQRWHDDLNKFLK